jgi:hypothetical protein
MEKEGVEKNKLEKIYAVDRKAFGLINITSRPVKPCFVTATRNHHDFYFP